MGDQWIEKNAEHMVKCGDKLFWGQTMDNPSIEGQGETFEKPFLETDHRKAIENSRTNAYDRCVSWDGPLTPGTEIEMCVEPPFSCTIGGQFWAVCDMMDSKRWRQSCFPFSNGMKNQQPYGF